MYSETNNASLHRLDSRTISGDRRAARLLKFKRKVVVFQRYQLEVLHGSSTLVVAPDVHVVLVFYQTFHHFTLVVSRLKLHFAVFLHYRFAVGHDYRIQFYVTRLVYGVVCNRKFTLGTQTGTQYKM